MTENEDVIESTIDIKVVEWIKLAKQCEGIVETSTLKDKEFEMLVRAAITDLERVNVDVEGHAEDSLVENTIMLYVKGHFGDTNVDKANNYLKLYKDNFRTLQFSEEYHKVEDEIEEGEAICRM